MSWELVTLSEKDKWVSAASYLLEGMFLMGRLDCSFFVRHSTLLFISVMDYARSGFEESLVGTRIGKLI